MHWLFGTLFIGLALKRANAMPTPSLMAALNIPTTAEAAQNWRLPSSMMKPNIATDIGYGFATSVDGQGKINLGGGVMDQFAVDAGILSQTGGHSSAFNNGGGTSSVNGLASAMGNMGANVNGSIKAWVPTVANGFGMTQGKTITSANGPLAHGQGSVMSMVG